MFQIDNTDYPMDGKEIIPVWSERPEICWRTTNNDFRDFKFQISEVQAHSDNDVTILVSSTLNQRASDESYGHDNLEIYVR